MEDKERIVKELEGVLENCREGEGGWEKTGHPDALDALRWYRAYSIAQQIRETYTTKDLAYDLLSGIPGVPNSIEEIAEEIWDEVDQVQDEWNAELENLHEFYTGG